MRVYMISKAYVYGERGKVENGERTTRALLMQFPTTFTFPSRCTNACVRACVARQCMRTKGQVLSAEQLYPISICVIVRGSPVRKCLLARFVFSTTVAYRLTIIVRIIENTLAKRFGRFHRGINILFVIPCESRAIRLFTFAQGDRRERGRERKRGEA